MAPPNESSELAQLSAWRGIEYKKFEDLPGYFVELFSLIHNDGKGFCSGAHIGGGYILTAAHCLTNTLCADDLDNEFSNFRLRYNSWDRVNGKQKESVIHSMNIDAIVMHKHYFVDPDSVLVPSDFIPSDLFHNLTQVKVNDIALIKVNVPPTKPFFREATLPDSQFQDNHMSTWRGYKDRDKIMASTLYLHGVGKEHPSQSYFGGAVTAMREQDHFITDRITSLINNLAKNYRGRMRGKLINLFASPNKVKILNT
ncbi:MAG: trypsin-like serine protease [Proteobacteria bacterium]|nr:trypsin-like serine protease [Pseudomonadota bacterium]